MVDGVLHALRACKRYEAAIRVLAVVLLAAPSPALADVAAPAPPGLRGAFEQAWSLRPEPAGLAARRLASRASMTAAAAWSPEPAAVSLSNRSDRLLRNDGTREVDLGVSIALWLPGERRRATSLAAAESARLEAGIAAARLVLAGEVRDAWWAWQRARLDVQAASDRARNASILAADVRRRVQAGDLARVDQRLADAAVAAAAVESADAGSALVAAEQSLAGLTGTWPVASGGRQVAENGPDGAVPSEATADAGQGHAGLLALQSRAEVTARAAELAAARTRANPELEIGTMREREASGDRFRQSVAIGIRVPLSSGSLNSVRQQTARAEADEAQSLLDQRTRQLAGEGQAARLRVDSARTRLAAAEARERLTGEIRQAYLRSFSAGETDLPTRLRVDAEAVEAVRDAARSRIDLAAAISRWRQSAGLLFD